MKKPIYIQRKLLNSGPLIKWAKNNGFFSIVEPDYLHTTIAYSRTPVDPATIKLQTNTIIDMSNDRYIDVLGTEGATVLGFVNEALTQRWTELRLLGCSWDYDGYKPHITFAHDQEYAKTKPKIIPYPYPLIFGREILEELDENK